jgi:hypothetical protein
MNTISFAIALIAIVFGAKLLAQTQKENLGSLYKYLSWFVIASGFFLMMYVSAWGLFHMAERRHGGMMQKEMRMDREEGMKENGPMWMHHRRGDMNCCNHCCDGMMNCGNNMNCCNGMMGGGNCADGMMNCGGNNKCADGMMNCDGGKGGMGAGCPMMGKMKDKGDSAKAKTEK